MQKRNVLRALFFLSTIVATDAATPASANSLISTARHYTGTNPTGYTRRWCARFLNLVLKRDGYKPHNSNLARDFAHYGRRLPGPRVGAIAVLSSHVGIVTEVGTDEVTLISGNHSGERDGERFVGEGKYHKSRIIAYVLPESRK